MFFGGGGLREGGGLIECVSQWGVLGMVRNYGGVSLLCGEEQWGGVIGGEWVTTRVGLCVSCAGYRGDCWCCVGGV